MREVRGGLRWPDLVLRGALLVLLAVVLIQFFSAEDKQPQPDLADDAERSLLMLAGDPEAVWGRVALTLRQLGHIRLDGQPALQDIRKGIKSYQHAIGWRESGTLDQALLNRILDEGAELPPYLVRGAVRYGRWFLADTQERCEISAAASRIEGRSLAVERPVVRLVRMREAMAANEIQVFLASSGLFNASAAIRLIAGSDQQVLHAEGGDIVPAREGDEPPSRRVIQGLRFQSGEVQIIGASAFGGPLRLAFPTEGFEAAYRAMASACGGGILHWIDD